jgi:hypothetical protein
MASNPDGSQKNSSQYTILPFAKAGDTWKMNGRGQPYQAEWDNPTPANP